MAQLRPPARLTDRWAALRAALASVGLLILAGCGGDEPAQGYIGVAADTCVVAEGQASCAVRVAWTTTNALDPAVLVDGRVLQVGTEGTMEVSIGVGQSNLTLEDQGSVLARVGLHAECAINTEADPLRVCRPTVLRYAERLFAVFEDGYPRALTRTTATRLANLTPYPTLSSCSFKPQAETNGRVEISCWFPGTTGNPVPVKLYINPVTSTLHPGDGNPPVEADYGYDDPWETIPQSSLVRVVERVADGYFYINAVMEEKGQLWFWSSSTQSSQPVQDDRVLSSICVGRCMPVQRLILVRAYAN